MTFDACLETCRATADMVSMAFANRERRCICLNANIGHHELDGDEEENEVEKCNDGHKFQASLW